MEKISPNFTNEISELAEQRMRELIAKAGELGVKISSLTQSKEEIIEQVKKGFPQRYELVAQKLSEEGLEISDLPKEALLDCLLGIDLLFRLNGVTYAMDVTSGKHTAIVNKEKKFQAMERLYKQLGIDRALIVRLREDITEDVVLDLFAKLEVLESDEEIFSIMVKYPETKMKKKRGRL